MAYFDVTQYRKHLEIQNISGSADAAAPAGGVYLFASGSAGNSKLYLQNEGIANGAVVDLAAGSLLDLAGDSGTVRLTWLLNNHLLLLVVTDLVLLLLDKELPLLLTLTIALLKSTVTL